MSLIGKTLGPYQIQEQIGKGGIGTVYQAYHPPTDRQVAVKVLSAGVANDPTFAKRFDREAKVLAGLQHVHILPVFDYGQEGDVAYLVMPYITGGTLADRLRKGPLQLRESARLFSQIASALDYAHGRGLLHRDIKPSNVLLDQSNNSLLADFGLIRLMGGDEMSRLTHSGIVGTPSYMSPEQGQGLELDSRSDLYSMGVMLYEMLTGDVPYRAETPIAVIFKHVTDPLPSIKHKRPDLPPSLEAFLHKSLAKKATDRFESAKQMAEALEETFYSQPQATAAPLPIPDEEPTIYVTPTSSPALRPPTPSTLSPKAEPQTLADGRLIDPTVQVSPSSQNLTPVEIPGPQAPAAAQGRPWALLLVGAIILAALVGGGGFFLLGGGEAEERATAIPASLTEVAQESSPTDLPSQAAATATHTPSPTATATFTDTPSPTATATFTDTPSPTATASFTASPNATQTAQALASQTQAALTSQTAQAAASQTQIAESTAVYQTLEARAATNAAATFQAGQSTQAAQATQVAQQVATDAQATLAAQASTQAAQSTATVIQQSTEVALASVGRLLDIPADPEGVTSLAFSPNGQQILSGGLDNTAKVWLVANGELVYQLEAHGGDILSVAFQNDGSEILTGGQDSSYRFWSTQTRAPQGLGLSGAPVRWVAYSPDGQHYAAISGDLLEVSVRRGTSSLIQTGVEFTALAFNGRGDRVVTANREGEVVLWSFGAGSQPQAELEYAEVPQPVIKLAFNSGETNLFGLGLNGDFYIWDARRGNLIQTFRPDDTQLTTFAPHPRRPIVLAFGTQTGAVYLFNLRDQSVIVRYGGHQAAVRALAFSADGFRLASGGDDGRLILWEVR